MDMACVTAQDYPAVNRTRAMIVDDLKEPLQLPRLQITYSPSQRSFLPSHRRTICVLLSGICVSDTYVLCHKKKLKRETMD